MDMTASTPDASTDDAQASEKRRAVGRAKGTDKGTDKASEKSADKNSDKSAESAAKAEAKQKAGSKSETKSESKNPSKAGAKGKSKPQQKANRVRKARIERMMSKAELARRAGLSVLTIDRVEKGLGCRMDTKRKILEALGLSLVDRVRVFGEEE